MSWQAYFHPKFKEEFDELAVPVQDELLAMLIPLRHYGPSLGRPEVDTLNDSKFPNMKELRFKAAGAFGGSPSHSIPSEVQSCSSLETSPAEAKEPSTVGLSKRPTNVTRNTSKACKPDRRSCQ